MRRLLFTTLGILELVAALVLFAFAYQLPGPAEVHETVGRAERVSTSAGKQVKRLRGQLQAVRANQPKVQQLTLQLQSQLHTVNNALQRQQVDYSAIETMSRSLGSTATGLDNFSAALDPRALDGLGKGVKGTADYLDGQVVPEADKVAGRLEQTTAAIKSDADKLSELLRGAPLDLRAVRAASASLGKFEEALERTIKVLRAENLVVVRDGFGGLDKSLRKGASQVESYGAVTYPVPRLEGGRVVIEERPLWPEGQVTAGEMRQAARGAAAAGKDLDALHKELPRLRSSLEESRKVVAATKRALDEALRKQEKFEPALKNLPKHTARLAEELPRLSGDLVKVLRATAKLKTVAAGLRQTEKSVAAASERWPQLRGNLSKSASLLRATQKQVDAALERREQFEALARETLLLAQMWAEALPLLTEQLDDHLEQQEQSLEELGEGLDEVSAALPAAAATASRLLVTTKLLLRLVGAIIVLHGGYVLASVRLEGRGQGPPLAA
jgi:DNA repair exonuclease SbcCD ATPase subunit